MHPHERLAEALRPIVDAPWMQAAWVGGSAAFGRADALSDLDLQLVCDPERAGEAFALVERRLEELGGVAVVYPLSTADYVQRFYQLRAFPETCMLDLCVMRPDRLRPYLDPVRHGRPVVWFDRAGILGPVDDESLAAGFAARRAALRDKVRVHGHIPEKALDRGHLLEAVDAYQRLLLAPLVELLRARRSPRRQDFGMRYLELDLPPEDVARLHRLGLPGSAEGLRIAIRDTRAWLADLTGTVPP